MLIDTDKIKEIIDSEVSAYELGPKVGLSKEMIGKYRNEKTNYMKMSLEVAERFMSYKKSSISSIEIKGLKKAVSVFNMWQGTAKIYFDTEDMSVWTNTYTEQNNLDPDITTIHRVCNKATGGKDDINMRITMKQLQEYCERCMLKNKW